MSATTFPWGRAIAVFVLLLAVGIGLSVFPVESWLAAARVWIHLRPVAGGLMFLAAFVIGTVMLVPGSVLFLTGGFLFGWLGGALWVSLGTLLGPALAAGVSRTLFRSSLEKRFADNKTFAALDRALADRDILIVILTRLSLLIPYNVLNIMYGLTGIALPRLAVATWIGMVPAVALYTYLGSLVQGAGGLLTEQPDGGAAGNLLLIAGLVSLIAATWIIHRTATRALQAELKDHSA